MNIELNKHTEQMLVSAVRYALGRRTYIVSVTVDYMLPILPMLSDWCLEIMERDLDDAFRMYERTKGQIGLGDSCDAEDWQRFRNSVLKEQERRKTV